ncbi:hypothetical protein M2437_002169 [Methylorubrum pseudosasae]|nr:hypothetical protein [Methylorubrum pseudosasae]
MSSAKSSAAIRATSTPCRVQDRPQVLAVEDVEADPGAAARADLLHRRLVEGPPLVGEGERIDADAMAFKEGRGRTGDARAPIDHRAEGVEAEESQVI